MAIDITSVGAAGTHSLRLVTVNTEDDYIYFKDGDIPGAIVDGSTYIYGSGIGSISGLTTGDLVYTQRDGDQILRLLDENSDPIDLTDSSNGGVTFNEPIVYDNKLNINISTPSNQAVKYFTSETPITGLVSGNTYFLKNVPADFSGTQALYSITGNTHTFTSCGVTGRTGPTAQQILAAYSTNWHGTYLRRGTYDGYQDWTVPVSGIYEFTAAGASGYNGTGAGAAGLGAIVKGRVALTKSEIVTIAVGQTGEAPTTGTVFGGSGGGTFIVRKSNNEPLFIAAGGSADAGSIPGNNGQTTTEGGVGAFNRAGGVDGFGGPASDGRSAGGGGFFGPGANSNTTPPEQGGGSFASGLVSQDNGDSRTGGNGGFGGAGSSDGNTAGQSGGAGGYSGGAGSRFNSSNRVGGAGGSFITRSATSVATSNGQYDGLSTFNNVAITNLSSYNTGNGSVVMTLVESFTSGNTIHPTAQDADEGTNAIAIVAAGNSSHALVPISYDIQNDSLHLTTPHGYEDGQAISINILEDSVDLDNETLYYVDKIDDFSFKLTTPDGLVDLTVPASKNSSDVIRKVVVNLDLDTITIPNHGFSVDQPIQYSTGGGTRIEPLVNGAIYYVSEVVDTNTIKLKTSIDAPTNIIFTAAGTGSTHSFLFLTVNFTENTLFIQNHGLITGQAVKYKNNGGTSIGGLTNDQTYYVVRVDASTIRLATTAALTTIANLSSVGTGTHSIEIAAIDFDADKITLPNHGFLQGELVEYNSRGQTELTGLTTNQTYYVIFVDGDNLKLATSAQNAIDGVAVDLEASPAGVGRHTLTSLTQTPDGIYQIKEIPSEDTFVVEARGQVPLLEKTFNPRSTINVEENTLFLPSHGFLTGTLVSYSVGSGGIAPTGLVDETDYYVVTVNQDFFRLAETEDDALAGITINLLDFGTGIEHLLSSSQLNGKIVGSGTVSIQAGSILVNGIGTSFSKILKVGDQFTIYPENNTNSVVFTDTDVNISNGRITPNIPHGFETGDIVKFNSGGGVSPTPLINDYYYYVRAVDDTTLELYNSRAAAIAGTGNISLGSTGTGSNFSLANIVARGPIIRRITAIGSDTQITVDRTFSEAYDAIAYAYPTFVYVRPSGYSIHRPFDGGVEMSTGAGNSFGQIVRQTRKYFRYQSGKGIQTSFAINFKPSIDIMSMERFSPTQIEVVTRRPHGLISGLFIKVAEAQDSTGATSTIYNGEFQVTVEDLTTFRITSVTEVPEGAEAKAYGFPQFHVTSWTNGAIRSGMFDFQNGMFFEFDGQELYAVRRSSTQQTAGTVSALRGSELIFGDKTKFTAQFDEGDNIVLRGQTYKVISIASDTEMSVRPEYRGSTGIEIIFDPATELNLTNDTFTIVRHGLSQNIPIIYNSIDGEPITGLINGNTYYADVIDANRFKVMATPNAETDVNLTGAGTTSTHSFVPAKSGIIVTKTVDTRVPQNEWNIDKCDGTGPSEYNLDLSRIQMCYMDYSWYGAGKIRFGFKGKDGQVIYVHEFKHNNELYESYFRSGNLPARYEVVTFENPTYIPSLFHWGTSVIMDGRFDDDRGYIFTKGSQTLNISGTTTKSFAGAGIDLDTDLITSLTHGFRSGDIVQFQSLASDGLPGLNSQNPATEIVGSNESANLGNTDRYGVLVNSPDLIHLTPPTATVVIGGTVARAGSTVTVVTSSAHNLTTGDYVGIYGITNANLADANGPFYVTVTNATTFTYTKAGTTQTVVTEAGLAVAEVINFTTQGNVQYTFFLHPDGSLNNTTGPNYQPLISLRLSPSADSGLTGKLGDKDIINRMQVRMSELGVSTDELVEVKLILNGRLNNLGFVANAAPSLVEIVEHTLQDTISGGVQVYNFEAEGGQNGDAASTNVDIGTLFELSNSILGGDNIFPDGPDILTVAVSRLTGNPTRTSAKLSWGEAQA